ncbi:hypothetical protein [Streptomyces sp. WAC 01529]|uniref:hypothetical protein n=1 Tax=Streptomyces sp. WAC 01529 TaxID=2203205 RepID=UPI0019D17701|nr:hypothetical protein [Streptomyces sp. WAC 01529]
MITEAMVRLLVGAPLRSDGQLTIKSLAKETDLRRNKLTHKHTGLKDLFYALVNTQQIPPRPITDKEREASDKQKKDLIRVRAERESLRIKTPQMARVIHVLEVENHNLRESAERTVSSASCAVAGRGSSCLSRCRVLPPTGLSATSLGIPHAVAQNGMP